MLGIMLEKYEDSTKDLLSCLPSRAENVTLEIDSAREDSALNNWAPISKFLEGYSLFWMWP